MTKNLRISGMVNAALLAVILNFRSAEEFATGHPYRGAFGVFVSFLCALDVIEFKNAAVTA